MMSTMDSTDGNRVTEPLLHASKLLANDRDPVWGFGYFTFYTILLAVNNYA